jgi:hypothetical protein
VPLKPEYSNNWSRSIVKRCETLHIQVPLSIRRFMDRVLGTKGHDGKLDKLSRDLYRKDYQELAPQQRDEVDSFHAKIWSPAGGSEYLGDQKGLTFGDAYDLRLEALREVNEGRYPQEIRTGLGDFAAGLARDLAESAKLHGFYDVYSKADRALFAAAAGPHRATQNIPIQPTRR